ncbi:type VII secretion target [Actinophytocola sp.]|uniref:type VII secretion target n=1 Tax=Actinophytocola sp. TaxID=1872138 RepID=UPI002D7FC3FE|nr:type VII secretion target [Actinophytocola sp.]HET9138195.1 type VII secretion target [Actinophytocola sp.]HEU5110227.1 type VII secretion target [Micromonosporaceae bacterium]
MADGFGVEPGQVQQAANQFKTEGEAITQLAAKVEHPAVSTGQVGRHFQAVAQQYAQMFGLINSSVKSFGSAAVATSTQLGDVATSYTGADEGAQQNLNAQGR